MRITIWVTDEPGGEVGIELMTDPPITAETAPTPAMFIADKMVQGGARLLKGARLVNAPAPAK